jgi:hypothetical protein
MTVIPAEDKDYFCTKHGDSFPEPGFCPICSTELIQSSPAYLKYICEQCSEIVEAELLWLEANDFTCPVCHGVHCLVNKCSKNEKTTFHVKIDGVFDGVPIGKKIQEKNEQVKKHYAGYSYEQKSIKEKVGTMITEQIKG